MILVKEVVKATTEYLDRLFFHDARFLTNTKPGKRQKSKGDTTIPFVQEVGGYQLFQVHSEKKKC